MKANAKRSTPQRRGGTDSGTKILRPLPRCLLIIFLVLAVYAPTVWDGFTGFDDETLIGNNYPALSKLSNIPTAFSTDVFLGKAGKDAAFFYRPLQVCSYMIDIAVGGPHPMSHHVSNVLLHCIVSCLIASALLRFRVRRVLATFGAAVFAVHPVFVPVVAWIPSRGDVLITLFGLLSFISFDKYLKSKRFVFLLMHSACFLLAIFSKETAILFPVLFAGYAVLISGKKAVNTHTIFVAVIWALLISVWYYFRSIAIPGAMNADAATVQAFVHGLPTVLEYISKLVVPYAIAPVPRYSMPDIILGAALLVLILMYVVAMKQYGKKEFLFGMVWFIVTLFPVLWYRHELAGYAYDYLFHRLYLPLFGLLLALFSFDAFSRFSEKKILFAGGTFILLSTVMSMAAVSRYGGPDEFYTYALEMNPDNALLYNNRGLRRYLAGDIRNAVSDFDKAIELVPSYYTALNIRGVARTKTGNLPGAIDDFRRAIEVKPDFAEAILNRGIAYQQMRKYDEARRDLLRAAGFGDVAAKAYLNLGILFRDRSDFRGALPFFDKAIAANPRAAGNYLERGICKFNMGDPGGALSDMDLALAVDPNSALVHDNKGAILGELKRYDPALYELNEAIRLDSSSALAFRNRGLIKSQIHDARGACEDFMRAAQLGDPAAAQLARERCR